MYMRRLLLTTGGDEEQGQAKACGLHCAIEDCGKIDMSWMLCDR